LLLAGKQSAHDIHITVE